MRPRLAKINEILLLYDNTFPEQLTNNYVACTMRYLIHHPPYCSEFSQTDYNFFKHLEHFLAIKSVPNETATAKHIMDV